MNKRLANKVAIITGAASGIGRASALTFAREGARVLLADVDPQGAQVAAEIDMAGGEAVFLSADVAQRAENERIVEKCIQRFGRVDILFCNAGVALFKLITNTTDEELEKVLAVNLKAIVYAVRVTVPVMQQQGGGVILFTASKSGLFGQPQFPIYCASKGAVVLLAKALAIDYAAQKIRVNAICPGIIDTPMVRRGIQASPDPQGTLERASKEQPIGRLGTAQECADAALWLVSDEASFVTGVALPVDGGITAM